MNVIFESKYVLADPPGSLGPRQNGRHFPDDILNVFPWMKMYELRLGFHWGSFLSLRVKLTIFQHWFRKWHGTGRVTSHYLNQWRLVYWRMYATTDFNELFNHPMADGRIWRHSTCPSFTDSGNDSSPVRRQTITGTDADPFSTGTSRTNFREIWIEIQRFHSRRSIWKCRLQNGVDKSMYQYHIRFVFRAKVNEDPFYRVWLSPCKSAITHWVTPAKRNEYVGIRTVIALTIVRCNTSCDDELVTK